MYAQSQGGQSDSDKSHSHFLGILEYTLEILKPHAPSADDQPGVNRETNPAKDQSEEFENKFSKLELQEPSDKFQQFLDAPDVDRAIRTEVKLGPRYEADLAKDQREEYAAAHCFVEDVMRLYLFAQGVWEGYKKGSDLAAASVSISTTITFVRDLEEQFQAQFPTKVDHLDKVGLFYMYQCSAQNVSHELREDVEAYKLANSVMLTTYVLIIDLQRGGPLGCLQEPGSRDESVPWLQKSPDEKYLDNRSRLREAYPLLDFISSRTEVGRMPEDELIRGVREMGPETPISVWLVFAFHCFLNAQHTLGEAVERPFFQFVRSCDNVRDSIRDLQSFHTPSSMIYWPKQGSQLQKLLNLIDHWVAQCRIEEGIRKVSLKARWQNEGRELMYTRSSMTVTCRLLNPLRFTSSTRCFVVFGRSL